MEFAFGVVTGISVAFLIIGVLIKSGNNKNFTTMMAHNERVLSELKKRNELTKKIITILNRLFLK